MLLKSTLFYYIYYFILTLVSESWYYACQLTVTLSCLTGTLELNGTIVNVVSNTCVFPVVTSQNFCCENGLYVDINQAPPPVKLHKEKRLSVFLNILYFLCIKSTLPFPLCIALWDSRAH